MNANNTTLERKPTSLMSMLQYKNLIIEELYDNLGEINNDKEIELRQLEIDIPAKVDAWAYVLKNNGSIDKEIEILKERKEVITDVIKTLSGGKQKLKQRLHYILKQNNLERIDGTDYWIKRTVSKKLEVLMDKVEDKYKIYSLPKLTYKEYEYIRNILISPHNKECVGDEIGIRLKNKIESETIATCRVSDLPSDHKALLNCLTPSVMIYNKRKVS